MAFRETVSDPHDNSEHTTAPQKVVEAFTPTGLCCFRVRAIPLSGKTTSILDDSKEVLGLVFEQQQDRTDELQEVGKRLQSALKDGPQNVHDAFQVGVEKLEPILQPSRWKQIDAFASMFRYATLASGHGYV